MLLLLLIFFDIHEALLDVILHLFLVALELALKSLDFTAVRRLLGVIYALKL